MQRQKSQCGAKNKRGGTCKASPVRGSKRCRMHGGTQQPSPEHHNATHGFFSAMWTDRWREIYDRFMAGEITGLEMARENLALANARLQGVMSLGTTDAEQAIVMGSEAADRAFAGVRAATNSLVAAEEAAQRAATPTTDRTGFTITISDLEAPTASTTAAQK